MTNLLITNGANVNLTDYGDYTPLHEAAIQVKYVQMNFYCSPFKVSIIGTFLSC
jgi:ankyrin repeat protein